MSCICSMKCDIQSFYIIRLVFVNNKHTMSCVSWRGVWFSESSLQESQPTRLSLSGCCQVCFFAVEPSLEQQESQQRRATSIVDADVARVFRGCLDNIPQLPTNTVRIFLSSTFSGTCGTLPVFWQHARLDSSVLQFLIADFRVFELVTLRQAQEPGLKILTREK